MKALIAILAILLVTGAVRAGTVTLEGVCSQSVINASSPYATFTLSNLGNQTAAQLLVVPDFLGGTPTNASQTIPTLGPGQNATLTFHFSSFSAPGSYASSYSVSYSQGQSTFFVVFPCVLDFQTPVTGLIRIYNVSQRGSTLSMQVINLGQSAVQANVTMILPQSFSTSPPNVAVSLAPSASKKVSFTVSHPSVAGASYEIAAAASYLSAGTHYASIQPYTLDFPSAGSGAPLPSQYTLYLAIVVVIVLLAALIIFASIRKRRMRAAQHQQERPPEAQQ